MSGFWRNAFAMAGACWMIGAHALAGDPAETRIGYVIPSACSTPERIGASHRHAKNHTTECALADSCQASGYGLWSEGRFLRFDAKGHELALVYLTGTAREDDNLVSVTGKLREGEIRVTGLSPADESPVRDFSGAFDQLAGLAGDWEGRYTNGTWENPSDWNPVRARYELTGRKSAVMESYYFGESAEAGMSTAYHMDGDDLRLTHYCGAMNQPRMKAVSYAPASQLRFGFVDVTNLSEPGAYYSRELEIEFVDADSVRLTYRGVKDKELQTQVYDLKRAAESHSNRHGPR